MKRAAGSTIAFARRRSRQIDFGCKRRVGQVIVEIAMEKETATLEKRKFKRWLKRFGVAGFLFFLIKGLLWLLVPFVVGYSLWR